MKYARTGYVEASPPGYTRAPGQIHILQIDEEHLVKEANPVEHLTTI
jgi:hypothetical protein